MKQIYEIDEAKLQYPRECYGSALDYRMGILSPSHMWCAVLGNYGRNVQMRTAESKRENVRKRVNERTARREDYRALRREERKTGGAPYKEEQFGAIPDGWKAGIEGGGVLSEAVKAVAQKAMDEARLADTKNDTGGETDGTQKD